ncbi:MAG: hypothetical protein C4583_19045 [Anaerolineaceae bacterium]|nr:MAG: hypothetical protein C4583_19045 [Anaerolineaceae bacterium]
MANQKQKKQKLGNLVRLLDYSKYLYEQENQRNEKLTFATNIYLVVITFAFTFLAGLLSWLFPESGNSSLIADHRFQVALWVCFGISIVSILLSLIFTLLVVKVRSFERLCNPKEFVVEADYFETEERLIGSIISHYVVATERNFLVNNKKAKYLAYGLQTYIFGFILLLFALTGFSIFGR